MREAELWARLRKNLPANYVETWAELTALRDLDGRTVREALADGVDAKTIWRACWSYLELAARER